MNDNVIGRIAFGPKGDGLLYHPRPAPAHPKCPLCQKRRAPKVEIKDSDEQVLWHGCQQCLHEAGIEAAIEFRVLQKKVADLERLIALHVEAFHNDPDGD